MAEYRDPQDRTDPSVASDQPVSRRRRSSAAPSRRGSQKNDTTAGTSDLPQDVQQQVVFGIFAVMLIGMTVFQKIGYSPNKATVMPLIIAISYAALGVGILFAKPVFRPERLMLYLAVVVTSTVSNLLFSRTYSLNSMALYYVLYLPFVVAFETQRATYRRCLEFFSTVMLAFAVVVWLQHLTQFTVGWQYWPNLDKLVPKRFLIPEFNYLQPIEWGVNLMKPSGVAFLEVSILSQFLTFALLIELLFLQRTWRAVFFGGTLFATFAGTGLLLLAVSLPIVLLKMNTRTFAIILATAFVAAFVALQLHWFDFVAHRFGEFQVGGSSANSRFIAPLDRIRDALADPTAVYAGVGAGQIERGGSTFWWPLVKASVEYGLVEGILLYVFFFVAMLDHAPSKQLVFVLAIWFSFEATLLTALNPLTCVMLSSMFYMREERPRRRRSSRLAEEDGAVAAAPVPALG